MLSHRSNRLLRTPEKKLFMTMTEQAVNSKKMVNENWTGFYHTNSTLRYSVELNWSCL